MSERNLWTSILQHPACKYQLNAEAIAGFSADATSAADWDGAVAGSAWTADVSAHVRLVNQATGVIYTLTDATTCTATGETAIHGATLTVVDSVDTPVYLDTAATDAATSVFEFIEPPKLSPVTIAQMTELGAGKLTALAGASWYDAQIALMSAAVPALNNFRGFWPRASDIMSASGVTVADTTDIVGGGIQVTCSGAPYASPIGAIPVLLARTNSWGIAGRAVVAPSASGHWSYFGLSTAAGSHVINLGTDYSVDQGHLIYTSYNGGGYPSHADVVHCAPVIGSSEWHDLALTWDGTTIRCYCDGALVASSTTPTHVDEAMRMGLQDDQGLGRLAQCVMGWQA
jgi:hypothetical protein